MNKVSIYMEKIFPLIKNMIMPSIIFATALIFFYSSPKLSISSLKTIHYTFYILCFISFMVLLYFNQRKPTFYILLTSLTYILINIFKTKYGAEYNTSAYYINLCFFLPINLFLFSFIPNNKLLCKNNIYLLLAIFVQFSIAEFLGKENLKINITFSDGHIGDLSILGFLLFSATVLFFLIQSAKEGSIIHYALLFSVFNIMFGMIYSSSVVGLTIFFSATALTLLSAIIMHIHYHTYKDSLTGLPSRNSYIIDSNSFPLKYSLGVVKIDNYAQLQNMFGKKNKNTLIRMITNRIMEENGEENLYRYSDDEFIVIFRNENKDESYEHLEQIRRAVASAEFILHDRKKSIKLTVSTCVSEKKRSDANAIEVLYRIRKKLQKANEFSQNISSKA